MPAEESLLPIRPTTPTGSTHSVLARPYVAVMPERSLPAPHLLVDDQPIIGITTVMGHLGGYDLTIITTVGPLALDVQTSVLGHPWTETTIAHCIRGPGLADAKTKLIAPGGLGDSTARARRVLDHYAELRQAVERLTGGDVRIDTDDVALGIPATIRRAGRAPRSRS